MYSKPMLIALAVVIVFIARGVFGVSQKYKESKQNLEKVALEQASLDKRQQSLQSENYRLETDRGIEEEIRSKFQVVKPGEQVAIIVDATVTPEVEEIPKTKWEQFKDWVSEIF